jgi:hypothetical protein
VMKFILMFLGTCSVFYGVWVGEVNGHFTSMLVGLWLGGTLMFGALVLAISELPMFIRRRRRR